MQYNPHENFDDILHSTGKMNKKIYMEAKKISKLKLLSYY
jgi:hypothetical protein